MAATSYTSGLNNSRMDGGRTFTQYWCQAFDEFLDLGQPFNCNNIETVINFGCLLTRVLSNLSSYHLRTAVDHVDPWLNESTISTILGFLYQAKLEVTVGGGMELGHSAMSIMALLDSIYVRFVVVLPFVDHSPGKWALFEIHYLFDLPLPSNGSTTPRINAWMARFRYLDSWMFAPFYGHHRLRDSSNPSSALTIMDFFFTTAWFLHQRDRS